MLPLRLCFLRFPDFVLSKGISNLVPLGLNTLKLAGEETVVLLTKDFFIGIPVFSLLKSRTINFDGFLIVDFREWMNFFWIVLDFM